MSPVRPDLDLSTLERPSASEPLVRPRRRWWLWIAPPVVLGAFAWFLEDVLRDAFTRPVEVVVVRPRRLEGPRRDPGTVLVQAAGWVEPDPYPTQVPALADGVVARLLVQEADAVDADDVVAELVFEDAALAVAAAEAELARVRAERTEAQAERDVARAAYDAALERREALATARAGLDAAEAAWVEARHAETEAHAERAIRDRELDTQRYLVERAAAGPWQIELAQAAVERACARLGRAAADVARRAAERERARAVLERATAELDLRFEERLRLERAEAALTRRDAAVTAAQVALDAARLTEARMLVRAPAAGVVLTLDAAPGSRVGPTGTTVCTLYDPRRLRVRVDVPQARLEGLAVDLRARIACDARRDRPYAGTVTRLVEVADLQKVTLEVQVRVEDPDDRLKPDMLCQVTFLAPEDSRPAEGATTAVAIPERCLLPSEQVYVVDGATGRAALRTVRVAERVGGDRVVTEGLNLTDEVIVPGAPDLTAGVRVAITRVEDSR